MKLSTLAKAIGATYSDSRDPEIVSIASLEDACEGQLSFLTSANYTKQAENSKASAIITSEANDEINAPLLVVENPSLAFAMAADALGLKRPVPRPSIASSVKSHPSATIGSEVCLQDYVVLDKAASIGAGSILYPFVYIGENVTLGTNCVIHPNTIIMDGCSLGNNVVVGSGSVIGSDGFGVDIASDTNIKIPQLGTVRIEDNVEIGANTTIDRARFGETVIGQGTKIDNLVQIAHNVTTGEHCIIAAQSGISGTSKIGNRVIMGGQAGTTGHLEVCDGVVFAGRAVASKTIKEPCVLGGYPAQDINSWRKGMANVRSLDKMKKRMRELEAKIERLETNNETTDDL